MNFDKLKSHYQTLEDDQLIELHRGGGLTDDAYGVIELEMSDRSIPISPRPAPIEEQLPQPYFSSHWKGEKPLWSAYWVVGVFGTNFIGIILGLLITASSQFFLQSDQNSSIALTAVEVIFVAPFWAYIIFASVSIFRCAKNTKHRILGLLAQLSVLPTFVIAILAPIALLVGSLK